MNIDTFTYTCYSILKRKCIIITKLALFLRRLQMCIWNIGRHSVDGLIDNGMKSRKFHWVPIIVSAFRSTFAAFVNKILS